QFMTPTARYADVVLPVTTFLERSDILKPYNSVGCFYLFQEQAMRPQGQTCNDYDVFTELSERTGIGSSTYTEGRDEESWLRWIAAQAGIPDYDAFRNSGIHWTIDPGEQDPEGAEPYVAFRDQVDKNLPFPTPSGKIELYSERLAKRNDPLVPPIPRYLDLTE